jgi:hypothetical protein
MRKALATLLAGTALLLVAPAPAWSIPFCTDPPGPGNNWNTEVVCYAVLPPCDEFPSTDPCFPGQIDCRMLCPVTNLLAQPTIVDIGFLAYYYQPVGPVDDHPGASCLQNGYGVCYRDGGATVLGFPVAAIDESCVGFENGDPVVWIDGQRVLPADENHDCAFRD